jgi:DNA polymerase-3 subunit delta'
VSEADPQREADQLADVLLPEQQDAVVGHAGPTATLAELVAARRLPSGILLHGPRGIGKATLAFAAARDILTATGDEDAHRVAEQVHSVSHPNLFVLRRQPRETGRGFYTVIRVDDVRALRERMRQTRGRAGYRVALIDAVDDCNENAANALLKLLEEPPPETVFLLVSHRPRSLLPTIRSRCQSLALRPLADGDVRTVVAAQRPAVDDEHLARAADLAEGRPRRGFEALALAEDSAVGALKAWLADPLRHPPAVHLVVAEGLVAGRDGAEVAFARDLIFDWIAAEAREAAVAGSERARLASANELWEKASASFADADEYNLDMRQTLVALFDAIRRHLSRTAAPTEPQ